jgi:membrane protease YdiL (CAAX protease family)
MKSRNSLLLIFSSSWALWSVLIFSDLGFTTILGNFFYILGAATPSIIGLFSAKYCETECYWNEFKKRILEFRRIKVRWFLFIFGFVPLTILTSLLLFYFLGLKIDLVPLSNFLGNPFKLMIFMVLTLFGGPLLEEMGWRGYCLDAIIKDYDLQSSCIILSLLWAAWHLPLFLIEGTLQAGLVGGSFLSIIIYFLDIIVYGIIIIWVSVRNERSIFSAILFHFSINFYTGITQMQGEVKYFQTLLVIFYAVWILYTMWHSNRLQYESENTTFCT